MLTKNVVEGKQPRRVAPYMALVISVVLLMAGCGSQAAHVSKQATTVTPTATATAATNEAAVAYANALHNFAPVKLIIPTLQVDATIMGVGTDATGAMDAPYHAPKDSPIWNEVYWWNAGAFPGQIGNAVIAGHVNRPYPGPAPFTYLYAMKTGDTIQIQTTNGTMLTFAVTGSATPSAYVQGENNPVLENIFGPALTPNLNLITCYGQYDGHTFDHRLVIYTRLVGITPFPAAPGTILPQQ